MKKKHVIFHFLYYVLTVVVYMAFFYGASLLLDLTGRGENLGAAILVTYGVLFVMTPVLVAILMRFSLFKWYVNPHCCSGNTSVLVRRNAFLSNETLR